ncbi:hypothetical protein ABT218_35720 [Streptomyces sp. NPDC001455]|uniref:hypothetical protein n=1 Tax=Streptomyces sp. NPDC001455 TaxID=3154518 RepID=UPI003328FCE1
MLELRASTTEVAVLAFLGQRPNAFALWAGALSDRPPKRPQLIASDLAAAGALVTVPASALAGALTVGQLYAVAIVLLDARATLAVGALLQVRPVVLLLASPIRALRMIPARAAVPPAREGAPS